MKRMLVVLAVAAGMVAAAGMVKEKRASGQLSDLTLSNVEALARNESPDVICGGTGCVFCPITMQKVKVVITAYSGIR